MAIDLTGKRQSYVKRVVAHVGTLLDEVNALDGLLDEGTDLGYAATLADADIQAVFPHLDAATFGNIIATLAGLRGQITGGTPSARSVLQQARP